MEPFFSVITNVQIVSRYNLHMFARFAINLQCNRPSVVSSKKLWPSILLMLFALKLTYGSSVVALITYDSIVIAADSAQTGIDGVRLPDGCKIRRIGSLVFAAAGRISSPLALEKQFDVWAEAIIAVGRGQNTMDAARALEKTIYADLPYIVNYSRSATPKDYAEWITGSSVIEFVFAGFDDGTSPIAINVRFRVDTKGVLVSPQWKVMRVEADKVDGVAIGRNLAINAFLSGHPTWGDDFISNQTGFVRDLISREIQSAAEDHRVDVGAPISVFRMTKKYAGWDPGSEGVCR